MNAIAVVSLWEPEQKQWIARRVRVTLDLEQRGALAHLAGRAMANKSRRSKLQGGFVTVEILEEGKR